MREQDGTTGTEAMDRGPRRTTMFEPGGFDRWGPVGDVTIKQADGSTAVKPPFTKAEVAAIVRKGKDRKKNRETNTELTQVQETAAQKRDAESQADHAAMERWYRAELQPNPSQAGARRAMYFGNTSGIDTMPLRGTRK